MGGTLDPSSFGAFYNCSNQDWTFEITTADTWRATSFGALAINIDVDAGSTTCGLSEYVALVGEVSPGSFVGGVFSYNMATCDPNTPVQTGAASWTMTPNGVALTFSSAAIAQGNTLIWNGDLFNLTEWQDNLNGDVVPSATFVDAGVTAGEVLDSVPPSALPPPECSTTSSTSSNLLATTPNSGRAAAALRQARFRNVHDYGQGVVSFTGDGSVANATLAAAGLSARVTPNPTRTIQSLAVPATGTNTPPDDPSYGSQWNLPDINAAGAWAVTTGSDVVVADVDTGVDFAQSDLPSPQLVAGVDETTSPPTPINASSGNTDSGGHGTAVAGVIAAATNNSNEIASLGWNTSVMPIKASSDGSTLTSAAVVAGINYAVANGAKIINLSLGGSCPDSAEQTAVESAINSGVLVVAAAGNGALNSQFGGESDSDYYSYPAAYPGVIAVGATGMDGTRAAYSNTGPYVSMMAPGGGGDNGTDCITVLTDTAGITCDLGTSFAAPQVAAAAALIWSANPNLTLSQVRELLEGTTTGLGPGGTNIEYGTGILNSSTALADTPSTVTGYGTFTSLPPSRVLDTRTTTGGHQGPLKPNEAFGLQVTNHGGVPSTGVAAVVLNLTVTGPTAPSFLTMYPAGQSLPNSSNINFVAGQTIANLVTVKVGSGGVVDIHNEFGSTNVVADVEGYYQDGTEAQPASTYIPVAPVRLIDTRGSGGPLGVNGVRKLTVGAPGSPIANAEAVVLNVTVTQPTAPSFLTVYPDGESTPNASNVNFVAGQTVANLVTVKVGNEGVPLTGVVDIHNEFGSAQVVVDLEGYFTAAGVTTGSRFFPVVDHRILDTRNNIGGFGATSYDAPIGPATSIPVAVVGQGGILDGATGVVMNGTATGPTAPSFLTVYPDGESTPNASNINFVAGETIANLLSTKLGGDGAVRFYNSAGSVSAVADVAGWYGPAGT